MHASVRALFREIIDYAGLFPPARLPLDQAIRNYGRYRLGPESWMLGRFVCPAARLAELIPFGDAFSPPGQPLALVVLGSGEPLRDWQAIAKLRERLPGRIDVAAYECKWTEDMQIPVVEEAPTFFEIALGTVEADWRATVAKAVALLARRQQPARSLGFKLRCGGETATAFPTPAQVAHVLASCRDAALSVKFTAGLHHPLRHFDTHLKVDQHGFLNVFAAGLLAHARQIDEPTVVRIIEEKDVETFLFAGDRFSWNEWSASTAEIATARREFVTSFGSCSFEEPQADLREIGLLD